MIWTAITLVSVLLSWLGTLLLVRKLYCDWDLRISSVRALFFLFFVYFWLYSSARAVFYAWLISLPRSDVVDVDVHRDGAPPLTYEELDRLGIHAIMHLRGAKNPWVVFALLFGDAAHFGITVWAIPLVYELSWIVRQSMDRGATKERARTRVYMIAGHLAIATFLIVDIVLALTIGGVGYTRENHDCLLFVYATQIVSLAYMMVMLVLLKVRGRKYETIHGEFVASPVYLRLQRIMLVYAVFALQFQAASIIIYTTDDHNRVLMTFIGIGLVLYNSTGLALAITTGCSQTCVLTYCSSCIPNDVEAQLVHGGPLQFATSLTTPFNESSSHLGGGAGGDGANETNPPSVNPVFVFTDIESSSALWGMGDGQVMKAATELHDSILRGLLAKYRGYEITTAGDAFQLAFHTVREAASYCLDAQIQLVMAKWPKELHGMIPATERKHAGGGRRLIFNGLRVRMGIHDASLSEGALVHDTHAVTGKMTYTGASEVIANEIGDLGSGGQILVTKRVAQWLQTNEAIMDIPYVVERVGTHVIPQVNGHLEVFQVVPQLFIKRKKYFGSIIRRAETLYSVYTDRTGRCIMSGREPMTPPSPAFMFPRVTPPLVPMTPPPPIMDVDDDDDSDDSSSGNGDTYTLVTSSRSLLPTVSMHPSRQRRARHARPAQPLQRQLHIVDTATRDPLASA